MSTPVCTWGIEPVFPQFFFFFFLADSHKTKQFQGVARENQTVLFFAIPSQKLSSWSDGTCLAFSKQFIFRIANSWLIFMISCTWGIQPIFWNSLLFSLLHFCSFSKRGNSPVVLLLFQNIFLFQIKKRLAKCPWCFSLLLQVVVSVLFFLSAALHKFRRTPDDTCAVCFLNLETPADNFSKFSSASQMMLILAAMLQSYDVRVTFDRLFCFEEKSAESAKNGTAGENKFRLRHQLEVVEIVLSKGFSLWALMPVLVLHTKEGSQCVLI